MLGKRVKVVLFIMTNAREQFFPFFLVCGERADDTFDLLEVTFNSSAVNLSDCTLLGSAAKKTRWRLEGYSATRLGYI